MQHCLNLAIKGLGKVTPNPLVGCVIVYDNKIIAEGYHQQFGQAHAEPNAINLVPDELLKKCTLYVTLEPCCHFGKTPPCVNLIINKKIPHVVIGNLDSNPLVAGNGMQALLNAGINVTYGILDKECKELNKRFFTFHEKKRPYIILKWAQTNDGFMSKNPLPINKADNWITCDESKQLVHQWRAQEQAILVGYKTVLADNPKLTTRLANGNNPTRIVLDQRLELQNNLNVFDANAKTIVFNEILSLTNNNLTYHKINFDNLATNILNACYNLNITSIIIEGGTNTLNLFINSSLWDEARVFINSSLNFNTGVKAPKINLQNTQASHSGTDLLYLLTNNTL